MARGSLTVSGHNFHGYYSVTFRGDPRGFVLSDSQSRRYRKALCGMSDCTCGGGYGDGPDSDSASIVQILLAEEPVPEHLRGAAWKAIQSFNRFGGSEPLLVLPPAA